MIISSTWEASEEEGVEEVVEAVQASGEVTISGEALTRFEYL